MVVVWPEEIGWLNIIGPSEKNSRKNCTQRAGGVWL